MINARASINAGNRRCFSCGSSFTDHHDYWCCQRCSPRPAARLGDPFETEISAHLRTTAAWLIEANRHEYGKWPTETELSFHLWKFSMHNMLAVERELTIAPLRTRVTLYQLTRKVAREALADERSIDVLAKRDASGKAR